MILDTERYVSLRKYAKMLNVNPSGIHWALKNGKIAGAYFSEQWRMWFIPISENMEVKNG